MVKADNKFNIFNNKEVFSLTEKNSNISYMVKKDIFNLDYSLLDKDILEKATKIVLKEMTTYNGTEMEVKIHNQTLSDCASGDKNAKLGVIEKIKKIIEHDYKLVEEPFSNLYVKKIFEDNYGLGCIEDLLDDDTICEIFVNGYNSIWVDVGGEKVKTNRQFKSDEDVIRVMSTMLKSDNESINYNNPRIESKLKNGYRLKFSIPPVAKRPYMNIRKHDTFEVSTENLLNAGTLTKDMVNTIKKIVRGRANILIIGETGSGKTKFLEWLIDCFNPNHRIVTIETDFELKVDEKYGDTRNIISFECHKELGVGMGDLFYDALRCTPDIIVVGEARASIEGEELLKAMRRGHPGSVGSFHTNSPRSAIPDFANMINEDGKMRDIKELNYRIATGINFIIQIKKFSKDKKRILTNITEVIPTADRNYVLQDIYRFEVDENEPELASKGKFVKVANISEERKQYFNFYGLPYSEMEDI